MLSQIVRKRVGLYKKHTKQKNLRMLCKIQKLHQMRVPVVYFSFGRHIGNGVQIKVFSYVILVHTKTKMKSPLKTFFVKIITYDVPMVTQIK